MAFFFRKGGVLYLSEIECENDMQMVSFVLKSGQILPKGGIKSDKKLLISE